MLLVDDDQAEPLSGAKTAERGPTQTRASPVRSRIHSSWRSPAASGVQDGDHVAEALDEAPNVCGVSAISGTSTIAPRPLEHCSAARR